MPLPEETLNERLVRAMRYIMMLQQEVREIRKMGLSTVYQNPFRDFEDQLGLMAIIMEHMGNNPTPLYFVNRKAPTLLMPTEGLEIPPSLLRMMGSDDEPE